MSDNTNTENTEESTPDLTNVKVDQVLEVCREVGCVVGEVRSYFVIEAPNFNKKCLYVGKAKRRLTRIDLSGFVAEDHDAITHLSAEEAKALKLGAVRGQIEPKKLRDETIDVLDAVRQLALQILEDEEGFKLGKRQVKVEEVMTEETTSSENVDEAVRLAEEAEELFNADADEEEVEVDAEDLATAMNELAATA